MRVLVIIFFNVWTFYLAAAREAIINGDKADQELFQYQVALLVNGKDTCGGAIIHEKFILTAAQCVIHNNGEFYHEKLSILAGTSNLRKRNDTTFIVDVKKVYVPVEYNAMDLSTFGDIALFKLKKGLKLLKHKNLRKLELPTNKTNTYVGKTAVIAGFGWTWIETIDGRESGDNSYASLRFAYANILSDCEINNVKYKPNDKEICAKIHQRRNSGPRGVCTGDSGSPLVYRGTTVVGILIGGPPDCDEHEISAIYTRVSYYQSFIEKAMKDSKDNSIRVFEPI